MPIFKIKSTFRKNDSVIITETTLTEQHFENFLTGKANMKI